MKQLGSYMAGKWLKPPEATGFRIVQYGHFEAGCACEPLAFARSKQNLKRDHRDKTFPVPKLPCVFTLQICFYLRRFLFIIFYIVGKKGQYSLKLIICG